MKRSLSQGTVTTSLLDQVVSASGISEMFARPTIRRACERAGVDPDRLTPQALVSAMPHIEQAIRLYVPEERIARHLYDLKLLTR